MSLHSLKQTPLSKKDFMVVEDMANEVLVYNTANNKLHVLSPIAAAVWNRCDGKTPISAIANQMAVGTDTGNKEDIVWLALAELEKNDLLQGHLKVPQDYLSRRTMIQKAALATALALPFITTLIAPSPAHADSTGQGGVPGNGNSGNGKGGGGGNGTGNEGNGVGPNP